MLVERGKLYIVATPIGNFKDITYRALEVLQNVHVILSEDTRETSKLLKHFNLSKPQFSYRDQNHDHVLPKIKDLLDIGQDLALVSDSGTPLISDPGFKLINTLKTQGYTVISIPGPSALISALVSSGLPTDKFTFLGFLPKSVGKRLELLKTYGADEATLIIYESPYRVSKLLNEIKTTLGNRKICVASELTKLHEQLIFGDIDAILLDCSTRSFKGEYIVLIAKEGF